MSASNWSKRTIREDLGHNIKGILNRDGRILPSYVGWLKSDQRSSYMQITVSGHHVDITNSLRSYVDTRLEKLERHFDKITHINVILTVEKLRQKAESTVLISGGEVYADAESDDMYAAIDMLTDKLDRQLIKQKEKFSDKKLKIR